MSQPRLFPRGKDRAGRPITFIPAVLIVLLLLVPGGEIPLYGEDSPQPSAAAGSQQQTATIPAGTGSGAVAPRFLRVIDAGNGTLYAAVKLSGFMVSLDGGKSWEARNKGLPARVVYPYREGEIKDLTAVAFDGENIQRVAVTTSYGLFVSENGGQNFNPVSLKTPLKYTACLTSAAIAPGVKDVYAVGTSFSGFFETKDGGYSWTNLAEPIAALKQGAGFYEEVSGCAYSPSGAEIYIALGFGKGLFRYDRTKKTLAKVEFPGSAETIRWIGFRTGDGGPVLDVLTDAGTWSGTPRNGGMVFDPAPRPPAAGPGKVTGGVTGAAAPASPAAASGSGVTSPAASPAAAPQPAAPSGTASNGSPAVKAPAARSANRTGIYLNPSSAAAGKIDKFLDFLVSQGLDSFVLDMKDDNGFLTYDTALDMPKAIGAVSRWFTLSSVIEKAHQRGIYVIGRIVVFKDPKLYRYRDNAYAVWDRVTGKPWGNLIRETDQATGEEREVQKEFWVDPYSEQVWDYNIAIAEELQKRGVDEIQFDYIRFPSDGDLGTITYRFRKPGMGKGEALESFLTKARERITVPISTDLYGFNAWYRMGNWIGQNIEMLCDYVDVVCPMFYPSHFPREFQNDTPYLDRAEFIYREGTRRAKSIAAGRAFVRPYIQSFLIGGELKFEEPVYSAYLIRQLTGARDSSGFTLWNAANRYYMVTSRLNAFAEAYRTR